MTSFGATKPPHVRGNRYNPTFTIQGQVCHRLGSLLPNANNAHQFLQIYFVGDNQNQVGMAITHGILNATTIQSLQQMLQTNNGYTR